MTTITDLVPPIVNNVDRQWALDQCPPWAVRGNSAAPHPPEPDGEDGTPAPSGSKVLIWDRFVADQIESFEKFFNLQGERKALREWSDLWRKGWWPKADVRKRYPKLVPKTTELWPTFRKGTAEFECALRLANRIEHKVWSHVGVVTFKPDDPRVARIAALDVPIPADARQIDRKSAAAGGDQ